MVKRQIDLEMESTAMFKDIRKNQDRFRKEKERGKKKDSGFRKKRR